MDVNRKSAVLIALVMASLAAVASAAPDYGGRGGGWGSGGAYQRTYDPATVETVTGEVVAVERITPIKGMRAGIHLQFKTGKGTISVHLGPAWFVERLDAQIKKGDKLEITGSRATIAGKMAIIAAVVKKGDALLKLRDEKGIPVWAGWRR